MNMSFDGSAEAYEDMMTVQGFKTIEMTILMVEKLVVGVRVETSSMGTMPQASTKQRIELARKKKREIGAHDFNRQSRMKSDRKFLKPKKGMTFDTGKMHNKRNNENKIAVTHIDRIQDYG